MTSLVAVARRVGAASLAGVVAGIVVGGLLGRIVMRVAGFTAGPELAGAFTANGNRVGDITFAGTADIVIFVGLSAGFAGGVLYALVEPWLRPLRPWHGLGYGVGLFVTFGFLVLDPTNRDFQRFGSPPLNITMFTSLFLVFGVVVAWLFDRVHAAIAGPGRGARVAEILAFVALVPGLVVGILVGIAVAGIAQPLFPIVCAAGLLVGTVARRSRLPDLVGWGAFAVPMAIGAARTIGGLSDLLSGS